MGNREIVALFLDRGMRGGVLIVQHGGRLRCAAKLRMQCGAELSTKNRIDIRWECEKPLRLATPQVKAVGQELGGIRRRINSEDVGCGLSELP